MNILKAFNGDKFISNTFLTLRDAFKIDTVIETGTYEGDTTLFLYKNFKNVYTIEMHEQNYNFALNRFNSLNVKPNLIFGKSEEVLKDLIINNKITDKTIFFLDAHWWGCPLQQELDIIAECNIKPIIAIHDFVVPNAKSLGYDYYDNQAFTYEWLKPNFDKIYNGRYNYWYNDDVLSEGAKRGIIYLVPDNYAM